MNRSEKTQSAAPSLRSGCSDPCTRSDTWAVLASRSRICFCIHMNSLLIYLSIYLSIYPSTYLSFYLSTYLSICLSASLKTQPFCETSSILELDNIKNETILRELLNFDNIKKKSARLPQFLKLATSKTKHFWETSFKHGQLSAELTASYQCVLRFFDSTCLNYYACHEKVIPGQTKCCTCHAKSSSQN